MSVYKNRYSVLFKATAVVLACLSIANDTTLAQSYSSHSSSHSSTLAIQSIFNPIINAVGRRHQKQVELELSGIIAMALRRLKRDDARNDRDEYGSFLNINSALDKRCGDPRHDDKGFVERTLEVVDCPKISEDNPEKPVVIRIKTVATPEAQKRFTIIFKGDKLDDMFDASKIEIVEEQPPAAGPASDGRASTQGATPTRKAVKLKTEKILNRFGMSIRDFNGKTIIDLKGGFASGEEHILWRMYHYKYSEASNRVFARYFTGDLVENEIKTRSGKVRVLDLGCGAIGRAINELSDAYPGKVEAHGVDISIENRNESSGAKLVEADIRKMPYEDNFFDIVYESFVLEYFTEANDFRKAMSEVMRVLKPGGVFIFFDIGDFGIKNIKSVLDKIGIEHETDFEPYSTLIVTKKPAAGQPATALKETIKSAISVSDEPGRGSVSQSAPYQKPLDFINPEQVSSLYRHVYSLRKLSGNIDRLLEHVQRGEVLAEKIAASLKLSPIERDALPRAFALHDLGKMQSQKLWDTIISPREIPRKDLNNPERALINRHAGFSVDIIKELGLPVEDDVISLVKNHHTPREFGDGKLRFLAEIIYWADVVDAMMSKRFYKINLGNSNDWVIESMTDLRETLTKLHDNNIASKRCIYQSVYDALRRFVETKEFSDLYHEVPLGKYAQKGRKKSEDITISNELLLLNRISRYLENYPVDEIIDLSLIPKEDLEANMETWAYIIALNNSHGLDVDYVFKSEDEGYKAEAKRILHEKINDLASVKHIDIDELKARVVGISRPDALQVHIIRKEELERLKDIPEDVLPVAMSSGETLEGVPLRDFVSASAIGLAQAACKRMKMDKDPHLSEMIEIEILPRMQHIYQRFFPDKDIREIVTKETVLNMIDDNPRVRKNLAIALALPPIIKAAIQYLKDYHDRIHLLQQAA